MISVSDVRDVLGVVTTTDDKIIANKIKLSYSLLSNMCSINMATSGADFKERINFLTDEMIFVLGICDPEITAIEAIDVNETHYNLDPTVGNDYIQLSSRMFQVKNTGSAFKRAIVTYKNDGDLDSLNEIAKDIACFEYLKQAKNTGAINKTTSAMNNLTMYFKTEKDFYIDIRERVNMIYTAGV